MPDSGILALFDACFDVANRAAHIADFYMTKYLAKPQQVLASALGPLIEGMRRLEEEDAENPVDRSRIEAARRKLRRLMFSANRSTWFSACELAIYIITGKTAVKGWEVLNCRTTEVYSEHIFRSNKSNQAKQNTVW